MMSNNQYELNLTVKFDCPKYVMTFTQFQTCGVCEWFDKSAKITITQETKKLENCNYNNNNNKKNKKKQ